MTVLNIQIPDYIVCALGVWVLALTVESCQKIYIEYLKWKLHKKREE